MIAQNVAMKLEGTHLLSFQAFGQRVAAKTTPEAMKRLIETLPEFKQLSAIRETANTSVIEKGIEPQNQSQEKNSDAENLAPAGPGAATGELRQTG